MPGGAGLALLLLLGAASSVAGEAAEGCQQLGCASESLGEQASRLRNLLSAPGSPLNASVCSWARAVQACQSQGCGQRAATQEATRLEARCATFGKNQRSRRACADACNVMKTNVNKLLPKSDMSKDPAGLKNFCRAADAYNICMKGCSLLGGTDDYGDTLKAKMEKYACDALDEAKNKASWAAPASLPSPVPLTLCTAALLAAFC